MLAKLVPRARFDYVVSTAVPRNGHSAGHVIRGCDIRYHGDRTGPVTTYLAGWYSRTLYWIEVQGVNNALQGISKASQVLGVEFGYRRVVSNSV